MSAPTGMTSEKHHPMRHSKAGRVKDSNLGKHTPTDSRSVELRHQEVAEFIDHEVREAGEGVHGVGPAAFDGGEVAPGGEVGALRVNG
jgi:hypothetical protein